MITGVAVNEENVAAHIKKGGPGMPSFGTTLSDADVADVVRYLHSDKCCVEGEHLPANPWYRAETNKWNVQNSLSGGRAGRNRARRQREIRLRAIMVAADRAGNGVANTRSIQMKSWWASKDAGGILHAANREPAGIQALPARWCAN